MNAGELLARVHGPFYAQSAPNQRVDSAAVAPCIQLNGLFSYVEVGKYVSKYTSYEL